MLIEKSYVARPVPFEVQNLFDIFFSVDYGLASVLGQTQGAGPVIELHFEVMSPRVYSLEPKCQVWSRYVVQSVVIAGKISREGHMPIGEHN